MSGEPRGGAKLTQVFLFTAYRLQLTTHKLDSNPGVAIGVERPYTFTSLDQLVEDFIAEVKKRRAS